MAVCKFWQQGNCRYGNNCRFEHPGRPGQQQQQQQQQQTGNRFAALSGGNTQAMGSRSSELPYNLNPDTISNDLSTDVPTWILSCYGPGRDAPEQVFGGYPREQSFEEMRLHYMQSPNPQQAISEADRLYQNAQQQIQHTLSNINQAIQFVVDAGNNHPNRIDICNQSRGVAGGAGPFTKPQAPSGFSNTTNAFSSTTQQSNPFGAPTGPAAGSAFGQPAALGQKPSAFGGAPAFGQPSQPTSAFGQPAALGSTSAFGRGPPATSAFGQTPTLGAKPNPFGTPAFGQPAQPPTTSAFGQPAQLGGSSAFGQPPPTTSAFGQPATLGQKPNPFGAPAPGATPFGSTPAQPGAAPAPANPFGAPAQKTSPFAQPPPTTQGQNPFGQPSTGTPPAANPFGQPATSSPFGQPTPAPISPFGQPQTQPQPQPQPANPFGAPATTTPSTNAFGQPATASPFGAPASTQPPAPAPTNPFGQPSTSSPFGAGAGGGFSQTRAPQTQPTTTTTTTTTTASPYAPTATRQHPDISSYSARDASGRLTIFKGKPVSYTVLKNSSDASGSKEVPVVRGFDGTAAKIWFPDGAPNYTAETEAADPRVYEDPAVREQWRGFVETGAFVGGVMPEVPPLREFCAWNF
ncbi:hypothetical protein B0T19DRAFT_435134 [Cercophora scortea]|uniref:C3H1-type domain-containing protein n=1 Tax=Cercophora scortea TaxID=314031 RepID=A0AAE0M385_9PEZI|nr:hypothetical protein B0T19DRAFT_435134 [Cercophora scortea]